ncbi:GtrA family protein [Porphyromonas macacae]|nr:GtrA family protein [Porphyromonas macacae]
MIWNKLFMFAKAQASAFIGGVVDYGVMIFVTEVFHIHYTIGIAIGGVVGAIVNFTVNKVWTFSDKKRKYDSTLFQQLLKFAVTVLNSIMLKSAGTFMMTTLLSLDYKISRIIVDLIVSLGFNYTLQKLWVFRKVKANGKARHI